MSKWVVWGSSNSWIVVRVDARGRTIWKSRWFSRKEDADRYARDLRR